MTGLEVLREEMLKAGATRQQVESKTVALVISCLTHMDYQALFDLEKDIKEAKRKLSDLNLSVEFKRIELRELAESCQREEEHIEKSKASLNEYIANFNKSLESMETPEARDRLRTAQLFMNTVNIDTKYDNTAFIVGLGALLNGVSYNPLEELKKINPKVTTHATTLGRI